MSQSIARADSSARQLSVVYRPASALKRGFAQRADLSQTSDRAARGVDPRVCALKAYPETRSVAVTWSLRCSRRVPSRRSRPLPDVEKVGRRPIRRINIAEPRRFFRATFRSVSKKRGASSDRKQTILLTFERQRRSRFPRSSFSTVSTRCRHSRMRCRVLRWCVSPS